MATIVLAGTFDTKGREYGYIRDILREKGHAVITVDGGIAGEPYFAADIPAAEVAKAAGTTLEALLDKAGERGPSILKMSAGIGEILLRLYREGRCDGVLGLGGSGGTNMLAPAFKKLPIGVPKLLLSTTMAGSVKDFVVGSDMTLMFPVTDIAGLNRISKEILYNAANAIAGMAQGHAEYKADAQDKPLVGITMIGITTKGVLRIVERLEANGFEVAVFHANGVGEAGLDQLIADGKVHGVIQYALASLPAHFYHGKGDPGPDILKMGARMGIPQVIVPGAMDDMIFAGEAAVPLEFRGPERLTIHHNPTVCATRLNAEELTRMGTIMTERVNESKGPTTIMLPLRGISAYDAPGAKWSDLTVEAAMFQKVEELTAPHIKLVKMDAHINDADFADRVVEEFLANWNRKDAQ